MQVLFYYDLSEHDLYSSLDGAPVDWWDFICGDKLHGGLRFVQQANGERVEIDREVTLLKVALGLVDARPVAGTFALQIGPDPKSEDNTTATLAWNEGAAGLESAINTTDLEALGLADCEVELVGDSWLVVFPGAEEAVEIKAASNRLRPFAWVDVRAWQQDGEWVHEIRLVQTPYAFTDRTARVVPPPPTVTRISAGGSNESMTWPEIQELYVPPTFAGGYILKRGELRSEPLSVEDDDQDIAAAIEALADEAGDLTVQIVRNNVVQIVFGGSMQGSAYDLLEVQVISAPPGDHSFELDLDDAAAWNALREVAEIDCVLSIEVRYEDSDDPEIIRRSKYQTEVKLVRTQIRDGLSAAPQKDWLRPPLPFDYLPYSEDQVITGNQHWLAAFPQVGNEGLSEYTFDHGLATESLHLTIRENAAGGDVLMHGIDYTWTVDSANAVTVTFLEAPGYGAPQAANELAVLITSAGPVSAFQAHNHAIANVAGLRDELDALAAAIAAIHAGLPTGALGLPEVSATGLVWRIPDMFAVLPVSKPVALSARPASLLDLDLEAPLARIGSSPAVLSKRGGGLLAAVHDAAAESMPALPLPVTPTAGQIGHVFENDTEEEIFLSGGMGRRGVTLLPGQFMAADSRFFYRVSRPDEDENSWYPTDFDLVLAEFFVTAAQLRLKTTFELQVGFELMLARANTKAQWSLVAEIGTLSEEASPATTGINLKAITWDTANPRLSHRIPVTSTPQAHTFGLRVQRYMSRGEDPADTLTLDQILYGAAAGADPPESANFAVRLRLAEFDVEDDVADPRGFILLNGLAVSPDGGQTVNDGLGVARILV